MESKRVVSKDTTKISTREAVESMPINLIVYSETQLFVEKELDLIL